MQTIDIDRQAKRLAARRAELLARLEKIEDNLDAPRTRDDDDRAIEAEGDEVLEDLGLAGQEELRAIDAALQRIEDGEYGICVRCGDAIAPARLEAIPTAALCRNCAR